MREPGTTEPRPSGVFIQATRAELTLVRSLHQRKFRDRHERLLVEGLRGVLDALDSDVHLDVCVVDEHRIDHLAGIVQRLLERRVPVHLCPSREFATLTDTVHSQGIVATATHRRREIDFDVLARSAARIVPALIEIGDPGNLGTILRTADWFGAPLVLLSSGSVDETSPKVVRSAAGSLFRTDVVRFPDTAELLRIARDAGLTTVATVPHGGIPLDRIDRGGRHLVLFGSEAHGISPDILDQCDVQLTIPAVGGSESLNLAVSCAITLYEYHRP